MAGALIGAVLSKIGAKHRKGRSVMIDNFCFRLHYKATFYLLIALGLFVTGQHYIDSPIICHTPMSSIPTAILNNYCWIHGTYSKHETLSTASVASGSQLTPYQGDSSGAVGKQLSGSTIPTDRHDYYQWVSLFLLMQSVFFYLPHWIWRQWEGGYLRHLVDTFGNSNENQLSWPHRSRLAQQTSEDRSETALLEQRRLADTKSDGREQVVDYLRRHLGKHASYGYGYVACEALNFVNACGQFLWIDYFLGGRFFGYGWRVLTWSEKQSQQHLDPQLAVFPRVAKCLYRRFGKTGIIESHDVICVLPLNAVNAKVYTLLWFWLAMLVTISAVAILYRFLLVVFPYVRWTKKLFLRSSSPLDRNSTCHTPSAPSSASLTRCSVSQFRKTSPRLYGADFSDWFVAYYLCKNVLWLDYHELVDDLDAVLHHRSPTSDGSQLPPTTPPPYSAPPLPNDNCYFEQNISSQSTQMNSFQQPYSCNNIV